MQNYARVIAENENGVLVDREAPANANKDNFRIVSHHGAHDWSPFGTLANMYDRFKTLPVREDGYFMIVEN